MRKYRKKRKKRRIAGRIAAGFLALILTFFLISILVNERVTEVGNEYLRTASEAVNEEENPYECILVLGCSVYENGEPSSMLRDRLDQAAELYFAGAANLILVSGDYTEGEHDEVNPMIRYLISAGVAQEDILADYEGFSTYESVRRAADVYHLSRILIVTQDYHISRAIYNARMLGIEADGVAAEEVVYDGWEMRLLREFFARDKDFVKCLFAGTEHAL